MDDRELVAAIAANDPRGLEGAYRRYADPLFAYSRALIGDREAAADAVHDTFLLASRNIGQLRDPARLRQWLYAIARHEGLRALKDRSRHAPLETAPEPVQDTLDIAGSVHSADVAAVVREALEGLSDSSREVADLAIRHHMSAAEIAAVQDVPLNHAHAALSRAREQVLASLGALLLARGNRSSCPVLADLLGNWDGKLTPLLRKRINRHAEGCASCEEARKQRLNPASLLSGYAGMPFLALPELRRTSATVDSPQWHSSTGFPKQPSTSRRPLAMAAAGAILILALGGGAAVVLSQAGDPATPPMLPRSGTPCAPTLTPSASASPCAPAVSPSVEGSSSPTASALPSASPTFSPRPASPAQQPPPPPPALAFTATATATCGSTGAFTLTVNVMANSTLDIATLFWTGPSPQQQGMSVSGKTAQVSVTGFSSVNLIPWRVEVKDSSGRSLRGPDQSTDNPCQ